MELKHFFRELFERWKRIAKKIGDFQARLILTLFYLFIIGPFALVVRLRADPLAIKGRASRGWLPCAGRKGTALERAMEQF
jgi:hypothetical protein